MALLPWLAPNAYIVQILAFGGLNVMMAVGLNLLMGYAGQVSLGHAAFMAVGAYGAYNFMVRIDGMPLLIAILLAQAQLQRAVRGEPPLLLLDEVAAHLDGGRRAALFEVLAGLESQAWITGTDAALFAPLNGAARFLTVCDGAVSPTIF